MFLSIVDLLGPQPEIQELCSRPAKTVVTLPWRMWRGRCLVLVVTFGSRKRYQRRGRHSHASEGAATSRNRNRFSPCIPNIHHWGIIDSGTYCGCPNSTRWHFVLFNYASRNSSDFVTKSYARLSYRHRK